MNTEVQKLYDKVKKLNKKILEIQSNCSHRNAVSKLESNTGNYDPDANSYWVTVNCPDCGHYGWYDYHEHPDLYRKFSDSRYLEKES